jgi:HK97 family phage portal protein
MDVPSVLINDTAGTTAWGTGIGEIIRGWYKRSVRARANSLQESMRSHLIPVAARQNMRVVHDFDDLLKLDKKERMEAHQRGINSGVLTPNEARREEDLQPLEGGDILYANGAIVPLGSNAETTVQQPTDSGEMNADEAT